MVRVERVVAVHDCGHAVNALTTESQVNGGVIQGISYALFEERDLDRAQRPDGQPDVEKYKIAGIARLPRDRASSCRSSTA